MLCPEKTAQQYFLRNLTNSNISENSTLKFVGRWC